jgi:putative DNA primase/helicase
MTAPQELLAKHGIKLESYAPSRYYTTCPKCSGDRSRAHQNNKVLGVTIEADGKVRFGCNHCGWTGPQMGSGKQRESEIAYDYHNADCEVLFQKVRTLPGSTARFYCRRLDGNGRWINSLKDIKYKPLYRWPEIRKAMKEGREIAIVEGEKDADNLWALGIPATCNFDGAPDVSKNPKARKWKPEYSEGLRGARLIVFNDNDPQGYAHADHICRASINVASRVRRLDLAPHWLDMPKGSDVSDWLALGHTRDELQALIDRAPDYGPPQADPSEQRQEPQEQSAVDAEITRLATLSVVEYEQQRKGVADKLDVRAAILDKLVDAERLRLNPDAADGKQGHAIAFPEPEPWPDAVSGDALLTAMADAVRAHVVMPDHCRDACALWVVHTYLIDRFLVSPRLGIRSPVKGCGKTLLLDVLGRLVARPLPTANVTPAAIFRVVEAHRPTLLIDEADTFLYDNDELRGVLNGNRKGSTVLRTVGDDFEPRAFSVYTAVAIALIGVLPDTLHDRAVTIDLQRRRPNETIMLFRPDRADHLDVLARKAARWAQDHAERVADADPAMPDGIINRAADNWRPLLAIADAAGKEWPQRARKAAEASHNAEGDEASWLELLLGDIRDAFASEGEASVADMFAEKVDVEIASADLVKALVAVEGRPWADGLGKNRDKPLTQNRLARMLKPLGIAPDNIRIGNKVPKGYRLSRFEEAFSRYLSPEGASEPLDRYSADEMGTSEPSQSATTEPNVAVRKCEKSNNDGPSSGVAVEKGGSGEMRANGGGWGLSERRIRELAEQYQDRAYANAQETGGDTRTAECDAWLRAVLDQEVDLLEHVEIEFERVMQVVFP